MPTIALASFPRSGNTMLRSYLEKVMGLCTGSDGDLDKGLVRELMDKGFAGEGLADKRVQVVKTHFPERFGTHKFQADKAILLVRNPLDAITSLYNMIATSSHQYSISEDDFEKFKDAWDEHLKREITVWKDFNLWWMNAKVPVHIVRYEDLKSEPKDVLKGVLEFVLDTDDISGTRIEGYLNQALN